MKRLLRQRLSLLPSSDPRTWQNAAKSTDAPGRRWAPTLFVIAAMSLVLPLLSMVFLVDKNEASAATSLAASVAASADDARSDDLGKYSSTEANSLVGAGYQRPNVNGYRFNGLAIPPGAIIDSVAFSLVKQGDQWQRFQVTLAFETSDNAAAFTRNTEPASRKRTAATAAVSDNLKRAEGTRYPIGSSSALAAALQEVVNRPGWRSGNSVALIAYGAATNGYSRLGFYTFDGGASLAPRIEVSYHLPVSAASLTATPTPDATNTPTPTPGAASTPTPKPGATNTPTPQPSATNTPTPMPSATNTPTLTPSASPSPGTTPVAGQPCPAWVHDRYAAKGPDGGLYPTWHPTVDPQYGCTFGHEHGDDPTGSAALRGHPVLFGYAATKAGMTEPHAGFKVYRWDPHTNVQNPTSSTTASAIMVLHQGTAGTARFTNVFHSAQYHYWNPGDGREVHVDMLAPFGKFAVGCGANDPGMLSVQQANVPGLRQVAGAQCFAAARWPDPTGVLPGTIPYEDWLTALYVGKDPSGNWKAYIDPHFAVFNPNTYCIPNAGLPAANPCTLGYSDVRAGHGIDPASTDSEFKGVKREAYLNQVWLANAGGSTTIWTDPYGNLVAAGSPNAIPQFVSAVSFRPLDGSNAFGQDNDHDPDGTVRAPN